MRINERCRELREDMNLTQAYMAKMLKISQVQYSKYELGINNFPVESLIILAKFFDVSMDYITCVSNIKCKFPKK